MCSRLVPIGTKLSQGMDFISTNLLQCKYSDSIGCNLLPSVLLFHVCIITIQIHHTVCLYLLSAGSGPRTVTDILCYVSVVGFSMVITFDSEKVSSRSRSEFQHVLGVLLLTGDLFGLHWICLHASLCARQSLSIAYRE